METKPIPDKETGELINIDNFLMKHYLKQLFVDYLRTGRGLFSIPFRFDKDSYDNDIENYVLDIHSEKDRIIRIFYSENNIYLPKYVFDDKYYQMLLDILEDDKFFIKYIKDIMNWKNISKRFYDLKKNDLIKVDKTSNYNSYAFLFLDKLNISGKGYIADTFDCIKIEIPMDSLNIDSDELISISLEKDLSIDIDLREINNYDQYEFSKKKELIESIFKLESFNKLDFSKGDFMLKNKKMLQMSIV